MSRYFIQFSYDGTAYHGWQIQPNAVSVQQKLNEALSTLLRSPIETTGAGRTDTGVHAAKMTAHFDTMFFDEYRNTEQRKELNNQLSRLTDKLNRLLPPDIAVHHIRPVKERAHARFDATSRTYHYHVYIGKSPFLRHYAMRLHFRPDFEAMNAAASQLLSASDFTSFSKLHTDVKTNICHVSHAQWMEEAPGYYRFEITADRFLRNMVRAVVGTLLEVGRGRMNQCQFSDVINSKSRAAAGESVPGNALSLVDITYTEDIFED